MQRLFTFFIVLSVFSTTLVSVNAQTRERCAELLGVDISVIDRPEEVAENGCYVWVTPDELPACKTDHCLISLVDQSVVPTFPEDYCIGRQIIGQNRAGERSITCLADGTFDMIMRARGYEWIIWSIDDPLPLAIALGGAGDSTESAEPIFTDPLQSVPPNALVSPAPSGPPPVDLSACSGLSAEDDARCIASRAVEEDALDLCAAAMDAYACSVAVMESIDDPCADADDALTCTIEFATETGLEAACEQLPADAQGTCFVFAAGTSGDLSLVERRFPPGDERDTVYSVMAMTRKDPSILEEIDDNYNYDGARVMLMLPMVLETGEAPPDDYCDDLRSNYDRDFGDYPEDATLHYDTCGRMIVIAQQISTMNEDEIGQYLITALRNTGNPEDAAFADQMEAALAALDSD